MTGRLRPVLLGIAVALSSWTAAAAESIRFCFEINAEYRDAGFQFRRPGSTSLSGFAEDYWAYRLATNPYPTPPRTDPSSADAVRYEPFRGGLIEVYRGRNAQGELVYKGFLDDGTGRAVGCMPRRSVSTANGAYYFRVWARHKVRGWEIRGVDGNYQTKYQDFSRRVSGATGSNTLRMLFFVGAYPNHSDAARVKRRYVAQAANATAFSLARERLGIDSGRILVRIVDGSGIARSSCTDAAPPSRYSGWDCIRLSHDNADRKTYIAHELGHVLWRKKTPSGYINYRAVSSSPACPDGNNGHRLYSIEHVGGAVYEGFAHAYSVRVWNRMNHSTAATYSYSGMRVNFDGPSGRFHGSLPIEAAVPFMETQCSGQPSFAGLGNELDWGRAFWQTASCIAADRAYRETNAFDAMTDVIARSTSWNRSNVWRQIDTMFDSYPSDSPLRRCWNDASLRNGVDH